MTKKAFALRLDPAVHAAIERLAASELRSANAQIEMLLREALAGGIAAVLVVLNPSWEMLLVSS